MMAHAYYKTQRGWLHLRPSEMLKLLFINWKEDEDLASDHNYIPRCCNMVANNAFECVTILLFGMKVFLSG